MPAKLGKLIQPCIDPEEIEDMGKIYQIVCREFSVPDTGNSGKNKEREREKQQQQLLKAESERKRREVLERSERLKSLKRERNLIKKLRKNTQSSNSPYRKQIVLTEEEQ